MTLNQNSTLIQLISIGVVIFLYLYKNPRTTLFDSILFISIILAIVILISISWLIDKTKNIEQNSKSIKMLESKLNLRKDMENLSVKLAKIEGWKESIDKYLKQRKAQADPRLILVVLIIILVFLYLSSQGNG